MTKSGMYMYGFGVLLILISVILFVTNAKMDNFVKAMFGIVGIFMIVSITAL